MREWVILWFSFVEDVDDDVFFWCWGFPSWFRLHPPMNGCQFAEFYYAIGVWSFSESF